MGITRPYWIQTQPINQKFHLSTEKESPQVAPMRLIVPPLRDASAKATPLSSPKGERRLSAEM